MRIPRATACSAWKPARVVKPAIEIPLSALREQVASAIQVVIQTARLHDGTRKITAVTEVLGLKDREYQLEGYLPLQIWRYLSG